MQNSGNKGIKFFLGIYNVFLLFLSFNIGLYIILFVTNLKWDGLLWDDLANFYKENRNLIISYEVIQFAELIFHIAGISNLRYHTLINILVSNFFLLAILNQFEFHQASFYWISARVLSRGVKHMYNFYIYILGRFEIVWMDYFRFTSFYLLYPLEVLTMAVVVYCLREEMIKHYPFSEQNNIYVNSLHIAGIFMIAVIANFASTFNHLHHKRQELLALYAEKYTL